MRTFIFACIHNAGRSQMSAALFNRLADPAKAKAISAGTEPAEHVHPAVVEVMREMGIDLTAAKPQKLTAELAAGAEMLITMGCGEQCPLIPGLVRADWQLEDPKGKTPEVARRIRDEIELRVKALVEERGVGVGE
ncbi:MAG: arsenate reductase ArsC [Terracidiphilus sp.]|nr:arsenate reductase ArsC [Terracidiphilus sp.]